MEKKRYTMRNTHFINFLYFPSNELHVTLLSGSFDSQWGPRVFLYYIILLSRHIESAYHDFGQTQLVDCVPLHSGSEE